MEAGRCRWSGTADDGAVICIDGAAARGEGLAQHWPPTGLVHGDDSPSGASERTLHLDEDPQATDGFRLRHGDQHLGDGWVRVESVLSLFTAEHLCGRLAVHAGIVRWGDHTIVLPGRSLAGKSTLCLAFAAAGAEVLSDEYALIEPVTGAAQGWHRPIHRRRADGTVERIPLPTAGHRPAPVTLVADLRYQPDVPASIVSVAPAAAAEVLLANAVNGRLRPADALAAAAAVARTSDAISGTRHDAAVAAAQLLERCHAGPGRDR